MSEPWYKKGLRFKCTSCGKCCTGSPGYVWVTPEEIQTLASFLNLSVETFSKKYLRKVGGRYSLTEEPKTYDCPFLKDKQCQVYEARPKQCRTFPFWSHIVSSKENWEETKKECEGICDEAPLVSYAEIQKRLF